MKTEYYYIQDVRSYVGNCISWWAAKGYGYTVKLDNAQKFTNEEAKNIIEQSPEKYRMWSVLHIDEVATKMVDMQDVDFRYSVALND